MSNINASTWTWALFVNGKRYGGRVQAVDPRDAVSRALTTATDTGHLVGEQHQVPLTFIDAAPGNADASFSIVDGGIRLEVQRLSPAAGHPDLAKKVQQLRCTCCGGYFRGRQFANQDLGHGLGDCCVDYVIPRCIELERTYGVLGVHFGVPRD